MLLVALVICSVLFLYTDWFEKIYVDILMVVFSLIVIVMVAFTIEITLSFSIDAEIALLQEYGAISEAEILALEQKKIDVELYKWWIYFGGEF